MMTVRFPSGVSIQYNTATHLAYKPGIWELYTEDPDKGGQWVASLQSTAGAVVEVLGACRIENPAAQLTGERALREVTDRIRTFGPGAGATLAQLKRALRAFDATRRAWKR